MRKHNEPEVNEKTRISIFTCSSGSAWKLVAGKHPFGKGGGTRGSVKTGKHGGEPRIPWVDAVIVGGSKRGDKELVQEALRIVKLIGATSSGPALEYSVRVGRELVAVLNIEGEKEFARAVEVLVSNLGRQHARDHRFELSMYPSMPPSDYRLRERSRKARVEHFKEHGTVPLPMFWGVSGAAKAAAVAVEPVMVACHCCGQTACDGSCEDLRPRAVRVVMEEVMIVPVAMVMSDGSIIPSLNSDDCIQ